MKMVCDIDGGVEMIVNAVEIRHQAIRVLADEYSLGDNIIRMAFANKVEEIKKKNDLSCIDGARHLGIPGFVYTHHQQTRYADQELRKYLGRFEKR